MRGSRLQQNYIRISVSELDMVSAIGGDSSFPEVHGVTQQSCLRAKIQLDLSLTMRV